MHLKSVKYALKNAKICTENTKNYALKNSKTSTTNHKTVKNKSVITKGLPFLLNVHAKMSFP